MVAGSVSGSVYSDAWCFITFLCNPCVTGSRCASASRTANDTPLNATSMDRAHRHKASSYYNSVDRVEPMTILDSWSTEQSAKH